MKRPDARRVLAAMLLGVASTGLLACDAPEPDGELATWMLAERASVSVGVREGPDAELFVSVHDAARLPDGGLVVLDGGAMELRFFSRDGSFLGSAGRAGDGPGEFRTPMAVEVLPGDTVAVWDSRRHVLGLWSDEASFAGERVVEHHQTIHEGELLPDGSVVVPRFGDTEPGPGPTHRPEATLVRYEGGESQDLGPYPYTEMLVERGVALPFPSRSVVGAGGDPLRIVLSDDTHETTVREYDGSGALVATWDVHDGRRPLTDSLWDVEVESLRSGRDRPESERVWAELDRPPLTPAFDDLQIDATGRVWVLSEEADGWSAVVHDDRVPVARIDLPGLARIFEIGTDHLVGMSVDGLGVATVKILGFGGEG